MKQKKLCIFDLDFTLVNINTTFLLLDIIGVKKRRLAYKLMKILSKILWVVSKPFFKKWGVDLNRYFQVFFLISFLTTSDIKALDKTIEKNIRAHLKENIYKKFLKTKKDSSKKVVIISATVNILQDILRRIFKTKIVSSQLAKVRNIYIGVFTLDLLIFKTKLIKKLSKKYKIEEYYTDDIREAISLRKYVNKIYLVR